VFKLSEFDLLSWNVNGIRAIHRKNLFINGIFKYKPDILSIQETKAQVDQLPKKLINIPGYTSFFNSAQRKGYSGVATYSNIQPIKVTDGIGIEKFDIEGRIQTIDYDKFTLLNVYYPNGGSNDERLKYKLDFYDSFLEYVNNLRDEGKNLVICGDLNTAHKPLDLARPKANEEVSGFLPIEREWVSKFLNNGYVDTFREFNQEPNQYTWWSYRTKARDRNVGWRLDYFFVNKEFLDNVVDSYILSDVMGSDHCPIGLKLEF
jgi:exodeoxyribonuclease-3